MATMIAAITTTAVFSVILSSFVSTSKADKREAAAMALRRAQQTLASYVTAVPGESEYSAGTSWSAEGGPWPLREGAHTITSLLRGTPLEGGTLAYTVASRNCGFGTGPAPDYPLACKTVVFTLTYPD